MEPKYTVESIERATRALQDAGRTAWPLPPDLGSEAGRDAPAPTPLGALLRDPSCATPREQLQAAVAVLLGSGDSRMLAIMGLDRWYWDRPHLGSEMHARATLRALRLLLRWLAPPASGDSVQQEVVDIVRAELAPLLEALDEEAKQTKPPSFSDGQPPLAVGCLLCGCHARDGGLRRHEGVVDAGAGVDAVALVRLLAKDLFSVHGCSRRAE